MCHTAMSHNRIGALVLAAAQQRLMSHTSGPPRSSVSGGGRGNCGRRLPAFPRPQNRDSWDRKPKPKATATPPSTRHAVHAGLLMSAT